MKIPRKGLCIGYDTRFGSKAFAHTCAEVVAATGIPVMLANAITPTPALSWGVRERGAAGGIMITSSHNPAQWNGVKYKGWYGGSGKPVHDHGHRVVSRQARPARCRSPRPSPKSTSCPPISKPSRDFADLDLIAKSGMKFCIDSMYGAGGTILADIFTRIGVAHVQIRSNPDPLFPGINPEPIEPNIRALGEATVANHCQAGLCTDGDADRIGATDEHGNFVDPHKIYSVLLNWVLQVQRLARRRHPRLQHHQDARPHRAEIWPRAHRARHRLQICRRPHARARNRHGRRGVGRHRLPAPPARARRPAQLPACSRTSWRRKRKLLGHSSPILQAEYGEHQYGRIDLHSAEAQKNAAIARAHALKPGDPVFAGMAIYSQENLDGVKFFLDNPEATTKPKAAETWLLLRASGTEPLLRIYAESCSKESVAKLLDSARAFAQAS